MVFNIHVAPIGENSVTNPPASQRKKQPTGDVQHHTLINVPADKRINKFPVRIFDLQPQR